MATDIQKLISEIATKNHLLVDPDDPVFAVGTINRLMLDEVVEGLLTREASARLVEAQSGKFLAEELRSSTSACKAEIAQDLNIANARSSEMIDRIHRAHSRPAMRPWGAVGLLTGLILFGCGFFARDIYKIDCPVSANHDIKCPDPATSKTTVGSDKHGRSAAQDKHNPPTRVSQRPRD